MSTLAPLEIFCGKVSRRRRASIVPLDFDDPGVQAEIVRCVNSHEALVAILNQRGKRYQQIVAEARAALAAAEPVPPVTEGKCKDATWKRQF